ncbi:M64 family metallopeptidase [Micromonospora rubida]|uniref:M64 family metallopeptidase n=1 Tax=Micromonospora rubida TaxID=2697657 RepID=A0ABW7SKZ2_9ACTN
MRQITRIAAVAALVVAATAIAPSGPTIAAPTGTRWLEAFSPDGTIAQVAAPVQAAPAPAATTAVPPPATVTALQQTGSTANRFDLVFVGDGYKSSELGLYHQHVAEKWATLTKIAPYSTYKNYFNVWMVDVVSTDSGVDNDPTQGVSKNTALGMYFWCSSTERLLCLNESAAKSYAANAPAADMIVAIGNSTKYGGAGYNSMATASGGNALSGQIVQHELGHSIGGLADEYDAPYNRYSGAEPSAPNVTKYTATELTSRKLKWYGLLGQSTPDGGVIGAYEGAAYYKYGLYRPSQNSLMRSLGQQFNTIGLTVMTQKLLAKINLNASLPAGYDPITQTPNRIVS